MSDLTDRYQDVERACTSCELTHGKAEVVRATRKVTLLAELRYLGGLLLLSEADRRRAHLQIEPTAAPPPITAKPSDRARRRLGLAE